MILVYYQVFNRRIRPNVKPDNGMLTPGAFQHKEFGIFVCRNVFLQRRPDFPCSLCRNEATDQKNR